MDQLSPIASEERATLARLGLAENTRLACCARVKGRVAVALKPERPKASPVRPAPASFDPAIKSVVIIGNGVAGVTAADHIRRRHPDCTIHMIGREQHHLYNRMGISRLVYGRSAMQGLYLQPETWYEDNTITCWLNTQAVRIDHTARRVVLGTGEVLPYDRLILATGSRGSAPPVEGFGMPGTFVLREAEDAMAIRSFAQTFNCRRAIIGGGGLLGLEAGYALLQMGLHVVILERSNWLLRRQLDARAGQILRDHLEQLGMIVMLRAEAAAAEGADRVRHIVLQDGQSLPCDLFLACVGITPNATLARESGLQINRGVIVDDYLRAGAPDVYAVGDVAEHRGEISGLWPAAVAQAEVAAANATGDARVYEGAVPVTALKVAGVDLTSIGRFDPTSDDEIVIALQDTELHRYRKLVIRQGKIVGAILLGYPLDAPAITAAIKQGVDVSGCTETLRDGNWSVLGGMAQ
jgi:NAD(P)H-nitrite reductase large subunit